MTKCTSKHKFHTILITSRCVNSCEKWIIENNGFDVFLPIAVTTWVAKCLSSKTMVHWWPYEFKKIISYKRIWDVFTCSHLLRTSQLFGWLNHLGKLNTKYGFPLPLPQSIHLWASQLFGINKEKSMVNWQPSNSQLLSMGELSTQ